MRQRDLWFRNAIFYGIDVSTFQDGNGDGVGDFVGLTHRLDYLTHLGVTCIWLLPFYPTPDCDNGYDIADYFAINPLHGTLGDFVEFLREAHGRGLRVLADLVVNHTSDQHPWFRQARRDPHSPYRDYYVWSEEPIPPPPGKGTIFPGEEDGVWTWDDEAGLYYYHRFYGCEPELRHDNPRVREEIRRIMGFWLQLGVDGFRLDAASHMIEPKGLPGVELDDPHGLLKGYRRFHSRRRGDGVLLAEADVEADHLGDFFGSGDDEMNLMFNFVLDNYLMLALARESAEPLVHALEIVPPAPASCQWVNFLRNLDELDLERLTEAQRQEVFRAFAPKEDMRIFGRGIRRRLAPMLGGNRARMELAFSLLFTLPGTPMFVYGDEIGMGDDLTIEGRDAVRTPMQWSDEANAGFSTADAARLPHPVISRGKFGYRKVNVAEQRKDPASFFTWMGHLIRTRRENPELGWGRTTIVETGNPAVLVTRAEHDGDVVIAAHNLSRKRVAVDLQIEGAAVKRMEPLLHDTRGTAPLRRRGHVDMSPYGYVWYRIPAAAETR
ncbi:MAG: alpha-amylase family protein [Gemmatimonadota bacterium]|nr:alpha-amylase family protein [Gemmatimonadota bacterium]